MKRWTIKELSETTDLKFAACILSERRAPLNPYSPWPRSWGTPRICCCGWTDT